jgi:hypothetical protein
MKKFVFLTVVVALCVPSYAETIVLAYKVTQQAKPLLIDANSPVEPQTADKIKTNFKVRSTLVFAVEASTLVTVSDANDVNQIPTLILSDKDENGKKFTYKLTGGSVSIDTLGANGNAKHRYAVCNWDFSDPNWAMFTDGDIGTFGKVTSAVIASKSKKKVNIPKTLKGIGTLEYFNDGSVSMGDGDTMATLDEKIVKEVNKNGTGTVKGAVALIEENLK